MSDLAASPAARGRQAPPSRTSLRRLAGVIGAGKALLAWAFFLLLCNAACRLAQPWLVMLAIDGHLVGGRGGGFFGLVAAFAAVAVLEAVSRYGQQVTLDAAGQRALLDLRMRVLRHLQRLPASFYDRTPAGRIVGRVTTDVEALQELFSAGVVTILGDLVFVVAAVALMLQLSLSLTGVTMTMVPVLLVVTMVVRSGVRRAYVAMRARISQLNAFLHEQVSGMPVVQMFGQQRRRAGELEEIGRAVRDAQLRTVRLESILSAATEMLGSLTIAIILLYGGRLVAGGAAEAATDQAITLGTLFAFVDYMRRFFVPLNDLSVKYTVLQNAMVAAERIFVLLDEAPEPVDPPRPRSPAREGRVALEAVTFGYFRDRPVLHDLSFEVRPGERVALVGATGAGKSSVLALLTRLYDPWRGVVRLDGVDVREMARADLRRRIGLVPQDPFLFHGTLLDNVRLGHPEISTRRAREAAEALGLGEIAARFPRGYDEFVAERGKNLSAGERQLVAFARVLVAEPEVLLLDEATANVDSHTEQLLHEALHRVMADRTALVVAHRLSTVRDADRILVLHAGRLVESGTHAELLRRGGVYEKLHRLQLEGGERPA